MENMFQELFTNSLFQKFIIAFIGLALIILITKVMKKSLINHIKADNWYKTRKAINVLGYILAILLMGIVFSDRLGGITVTMGFASAGIAFALREVITSVAGWLTVLVGGFYKTGDRVQLGGIKGDVIDIGILRTTVMELGQWVEADLYNGRIVRIANSFVFKEPVFNYSADFPFLWDEINIPIRYGSDYKATKKILEDAAEEIVGKYVKDAQTEWNKMVRKFIIENASLETMITIETTDNWVEYTVRYVVHYRKRRYTRSALFTKILEDIESTKGAVKFASTTIEITKMPNATDKLDL